MKSAVEILKHLEENILRLEKLAGKLREYNAVFPSDLYVKMRKEALSKIAILNEVIYFMESK